MINKKFVSINGGDDKKFMSINGDVKQKAENKKYCIFGLLKNAF